MPTARLVGIDVEPSEDVAVWRAFLQDLVARGLRNVKLVTAMHTRA